MSKLKRQWEVRQSAEAPMAYSQAKKGKQWYFAIALIVLWALIYLGIKLQIIHAL
ncbi:hypothetical protein SNE26_23960 [Mucilaginibacter sp. cycad4]|uniref:hypothetical protein n=1 Tax=Mucilaginibacter sp. cycad4 TaxID=3342096 RepID=UPI002AABF016|nr:hypothetical protein [Mucilaginibacter gossypii]WPU99072.1 hypothetical protein SNE26_23960 [Mucilaginibacter gossypii]